MMLVIIQAPVYVMETAMLIGGFLGVVAFGGILIWGVFTERNRL